MVLADRVMFVDTDLITTAIWSDVFYGKCFDWISAEADRRSYDLYIMTDIDIPWDDDRQRHFPEDRRKYFDRFKAELEKRGRPYVLVSGSREERLDTAVKAVD